MANGERSEKLGEIIRRQRELSALSMRQFADLVGISNPYLSQIERGLREPSDRVVDAIARALQVPADSLYEQAGMGTAGEEDSSDDSLVVQAIRADPRLTGRQRQAMLEVYQSFTAQAPPAARRQRRRSAS
jgi:transcriptional regulator with XRE-family HTH domain